MTAREEPMSEIDFDAVRREIEGGYISEQPHPELDLRILNYTQRTQWEWRWNPETTACRGLIVDDQNRIVCRPFRKFFTYDQLNGQIPAGPFDVYEKMDGSLGILYPSGNGWAIASRGSFVSDQAQRGTRILRDKYHAVPFDPRLTYLFEIIYPENRIVVDYGDMEELVLLAVIDTATGRDLPIPSIGMPVARRYDGIGEFGSVLAMQDAQREGFVVRFHSGERVKIKFDEYKRLHRLLTGVNAKHVWEMLASGGDLSPLYERVPDEYYRWLRGVESELRADFARIEREARSELDAMPNYDDRKQKAAYIVTKKHPSIMFAMMDGKDYAPAIWKLVKPKSGRAFRCDDE